MALVLLRVSVGWHFLYEGRWKHDHPEFSAAAYFSQARGPLAEFYHAQVPDYWGTQRLQVPLAEGKPATDVAGAFEGFQPPLASRWDEYLAEFTTYFHLTDEQRPQAEAINQSYDARLVEYLTENYGDIAQYHGDLRRLDEARAQPGAGEVPFLQERSWKAAGQLRSRAAGWLAAVDALDRGYREELDGLLSDVQRGIWPLPRPRTSIENIDRATTWGLMAIGGCLIAGLLSRLAAVGGAAFMVLVILAQPAWPGLLPEPHPSQGHSLIVNKEFVEMVALLVLAAVPSGRWGGLDFFVYHGVVRPLFCRRKSDAPES